MRKESYLELAPPVTLEELKALIAQAPGGVLPVYPIVYEDKYETAMGDGCFLYTKWVYLDQATAERACQEFTDGLAHYGFRTDDLTYDAATDTFDRTKTSGGSIEGYDAYSFVEFLTGKN